jgi:ABC-type phosphate transport system substrate-binding protein
MRAQRASFAASVLKPVLAVALFAGTLSSALADPLTIQGSTTFARRLMDPFKGDIEALSGHQLTVVPNKSTPGLIALLEGRTHMTMISSPLSAEIVLLQKSMPGMSFDKLKEFEITRTRVAIAVHSSNPVRKASLDQVRAILQGKISNWKALGGPDMPIRVVLVGGGGGLTVAVEAALLEGKQTTAPNKIYTKTPVQLVQIVEQEPGALGFAQLALLKQRKNAELVTDQPIEQVLGLVTYGEPTPAMLDVIKAARSVAEKMM